MTPRPNPAIAVIVDALNTHRHIYTSGVYPLKEQPPDGLIVELDDKTRWVVTAHKQEEEEPPDGLIVELGDKTRWVITAHKQEEDPR